MSDLGPDVRTIVRDWLKANGYDGLFEYGECGCDLGDLMPCDDVNARCTAGYSGPGDDGADFAIYDTKQNRDEAIDHAREIAADDEAAEQEKI